MLEEIRVVGYAYGHNPNIEHTHGSGAVITGSVNNLKPYVIARNVKLRRIPSIGERLAFGSMKTQRIDVVLNYVDDARTEVHFSASQDTLLECVKKAGFTIIE